MKKYILYETRYCVRIMDVMSHSTNVNPSTVFNDRTWPLSTLFGKA